VVVVVEVAPVVAVFAGAPRTLSGATSAAATVAGAVFVAGKTGGGSSLAARTTTTGVRPTATAVVM
jgi:hypothetical protein